jgi:hypothetical protein
MQLYRVFINSKGRFPAPQKRKPIINYEDTLAINL